MPQNIPFVGNPFSVLSAVQGPDALTIVMSYTQAPDAVDPAVATDALNPANYVLTGPTSPVVLSVSKTSSTVFVLTLDDPTVAGTYTLTVSNVLSSTVALVVATASVVCLASTPKEGMTAGAVNDTVIDTLRRFLSPQFRNKPGWEALLAAIADGDTHSRDNATKAFNQLFLSSASDDYLLQRAADQGVQYPESVLMSDELFRRLAVLMSNNRLVQEALLEILEVFYGEDSTRARMESGTAEPYDLIANSTLLFKFDDRDSVEVLFETADFADIGAATASEVAGVLSRYFRNAGLGAYANAVVVNGVAKVVVYSNSLGLLGSIQVTGGVANKALQFATKYEYPDLSTSPGWEVSIISQDEVRFIWDGVNASVGILSDIEVGDYVVIDAAPITPSPGYYEITDVHIDAPAGSFASNSWFSVRPDATLLAIPPVLSWTQSATDEVIFFRPTRVTVAQNLRPSFIAQHSPLGGVDAILPATSQAVGREYNQAPYLHEGAVIEVTGVSRTSNIVTVTTTAPHGLSSGQMVELRNSQGVDAGRWSIFGKVLVVTGPDTFTIDGIGDDGTGTGGEVHVATAPADDGIGPWVFDPVSGLAITGISTTTSVAVTQNRSVSILPVVDASSFPDEEGYVVFGFGTQYEVGPVRYLGVLSSTNLLLDKGYIFPKTVPSGSDLTWLAQRNPFAPTDNTIGLFLAVDSSAGRIAAEDFIDQAKAAGVQVNNVITYPGDTGLGGAGQGVTGQKISDKVAIFAGDNVDQAIEDAHNA